VLDMDPVGYYNRLDRSNTMLNSYEIMTIADVALGEGGAKDLSTKIGGEITALGGKVLGTKFWGKRKFAYEIKHATEGYYDVIEFELDGSAVDKLRSKLNLMEGLVRYLISSR
jgi:small subunit ribosomal protein S6